MGIINNILLVGGTDSFFFSAIVDKLVKERFKLFHIAGADKSKSDPVNRKVVTYNIDIDDEYVHFVVQSVKPDAIIYLGAFDDRHLWKDYHRTSAKYMCELTNVLVAASDLGIKKFIYLSSINVYGFKNEGIVNEDTPLAPSNVKSIIVAQGERLCKDFADGNKINAITLRFGLIYGDLQFQSIGSDYILSKCLNALVDRHLTINNQIFPVIHVQDAAIAVYKATYLDGESGAYNVCDDETINDAEICDLILTEYRDMDIELEGDESFQPQDYVIDGTKFKNQFSFFQKTGHVEGIQNLAKYVKQNQYKINKNAAKKTRADDEKHDIKFYVKFLFSKMRNFLETLVVFALAILLDLALKRSLYLTGIDIMLIFIVVVAISFGKQQFLIALMLSLVYYVVTAFTEGNSLILVITNGSFVIRILFLFVIGIVVAHTRDRLHQRLDDQQSRIEYLENEYRKLDEINDVTVAVKQELEERMITYTDSLATNYSIIERIDSLILSKVYTKALDVTCSILKTQGVSIYTKDETGFTYNIKFWTDEKSQSLGKSFELVNMTEINEAFLNTGLYTNKKFEPGMPILAAPIINNGDIVAIAMVWDLKFEALTMYHINLFMTLMKVVTRSVQKADHYKKSLEKRFVYDYPKVSQSGIFILDEDEFVDALHTAIEANKNYSIPFSCLSINLDNVPMHEAIDIISPFITDMFYIYTNENRLEVLIIGTDSRTVDSFLHESSIINNPYSKNIQLLTLIEEDAL